MQKVYQRINWENDPSTNTPLSEDNLNKMDYALDQLDNRVVQLAGYQDRVAQSEANAKEYAENAKDSENKAKQSELKAKEYMEETFKATPEGYKEIFSKVELLEIAKSTDYTLPNSKPGGYRLTDLVGNTEQNGEPSQDNPIAIENTFDCVEMMKGYYRSGDGVYAESSGGSICCKRPIPCTENQKLGLVIPRALNVYFLFYKDGKFVSSVLSSTNTTHSTTVPSGVNEFKFYVEYTGTTPELFGKITLTVNGKYVGQIVEHGKNLHNPSTNVVGAIVQNGGMNTDSTNCVTSDYMKCSGVVTSSVQSFSGTCYLRVARYDENKNFIERTMITLSEKNKTVTVDSVGYIRVSYEKAVVDVQVEQGEATPYEPYTEKVTTFFLSEPLREGDRLVKVDGVWNAERNRKVRKYSSTEIVAQSTYSKVKFFGFLKPTDSKSYNNYNYEKLVCDKFLEDNTNYGSGYDYSEYIGKILVTPSNVRYWIGFPIDTTLEDVQAYGDIEVEYNLATPIYETLDTESQLALNDMETFNGTTYIGVDSKISPTSISGEYGTSQVGAYTLKSLLNSESNAVKLNELAVAMVSL